MIKLKNKLSTLDINFIKIHKNCEKYTKRKECNEWGRLEICHIDDINVIQRLTDIEILEQRDHYYIYNDRLIKFFCQNL